MDFLSVDWNLIIKNKTSSPCILLQIYLAYKLGFFCPPRFGDFVDVSEGPHIPRTSFCFQYEITAAHNLQTDQSELIRRFQGVSLPVHLKVGN